MIASPPLPFYPSSQSLFSTRPSSPLAVRSPSLHPRRITAVRYSTPAAERPSPLFAPPSPSLYDLLGVSKEATPQEIKSAYRRLARSCHPDAAACGNEAASADEFMRIHAAYATLSDPDKREDYNRKLAVIRPQRRPAPFAASSGQSFYGSSRRTWETDQCW